MANSSNYAIDLYLRPIKEAITVHGTQFFCNKKNKRSVLGITKFQKHLAEICVKYILCRYKHPQTNGKYEKWNHTYEKFRKSFCSFDEFMDWYNYRSQDSLDLGTL